MTRSLSIKYGANTITFDDLDVDNELDIEVENGYKEYINISLDKDNIISLIEHLNYVLNKVE